MNIIHISQIQAAVKENNNHVIFIIHSKETHDALREELQKLGCLWYRGQPATSTDVRANIPGGIRVEELRLKTGTLRDYDNKYLQGVPQFRVVL